MEKIPDIYTDSISIFISDWGLTLDLRASEPAPPQPPPEPGAPPPAPVITLPIGKALVRMTHAHAKAFAIILKRQMKSYEDQAGLILLPARVMENLGITAADW